MIDFCKMSDSRKQPSPWSVTMIGVNQGKGTGSSVKQYYVNESKELTKFIGGVHHSRKISHQQVNYGETVKKLSKMQEKVPTYRTQEMNTNPLETTKPAPNEKYQEYQARINSTVKSESGLNFKKRLYNREAGRVSQVNEVLIKTFFPLIYKY